MIILVMRLDWCQNNGFLGNETGLVPEQCGYQGGETGQEMK